MDDFEKTFFPEGYQEYLLAKIPYSSPIVLSHNDCNPGNILASVSDYSHIMLIDYEYAGWQPRAFDLASYLNDMVIDKHCPTGIRTYLQNFITDEELTLFLTAYLGEP